MIMPQINRETETMKLEPVSEKRLGEKEGKVDENVRISRSRARTAVAPCGLYGNGLEFRKPQPKKNFPDARGKGVTALCLN